MADTFKFELVSPERLLVSGEVEQVLVPGTEGDISMLAHHAPAAHDAPAGPGRNRLERRRAPAHFVRGGFAEVEPQGLTVLAETAIDLVELEADTLDQAIKDAEEDIADAKDEDVRDRAKTQLDHLRQVRTTLSL